MGSQESQAACPTDSKEGGGSFPWAEGEEWDSKKAKLLAQQIVRKKGVHFLGQREKNGIQRKPSCLPNR